MQIMLRLTNRIGIEGQGLSRVVAFLVQIIDYVLRSADDSADIDPPSSAPLV